MWEKIPTYLIEIALFYSALLDTIIVVANLQQYDLKGAIEEKLAYNAERQDHKRENRAAENGKKF